MKRAYRPGIGLIGAVALGGIAWPLVTAGHGVVGPGGAATGVAVSLCAMALLAHPLVRSRPALLGLAALMAMTPYTAFLIGCIVQPSVPDGEIPAFSRADASLVALIGSLGALVGFLLAIVRVLQIRSGHASSRTPAE